MDPSFVAPANDWKNTKKALADFRPLLLCSKCSQLLRDPVCLGTCEHMLCRTCAGPRAGDGCVVCHSPSWVKDIKINRQLSSVIPLFRDLESMLYPEGQPDSSEVMQPQNEGTIFQRKKNFKIWLSPRSRKMRCTVRENPKVFIPESKSFEKVAEAQPGPSTAEVNDMTVFNFTSSSQDSGSDTKKQKRKNEKNIGGRRKTKRRALRNQSRQTVKKKLDAINKQWRIIDDQNTVAESEQLGVDVEKTLNKKVSFLGPDGVSFMNGVGLVSSTLRDGFAEGAVTEPESPTQLCQNESDSICDTPRASDYTPQKMPQKQADLFSPERSSKRQRLEGEVAALETTPKRSTTSTGCCRKSLSHSSPAAIHSPCKKTPRKHGGESPSVPCTTSRKSPSSRASMGNSSPGTPTVTKKNHKGETPLHLAAIKGDVEGVKGLLDQGADPNLKDNAGWTPLHEACNLGHLVVAEALLSRGALLNTPGYENDSPLHDAVRNGHLAVVKLLLRFGASQSVLNLHGKRPADYAESREMLEVFREVSEGAQYASASLNSPASLPVVDNCAKPEETLLFLSSKLSQTERHQFAKLSRLLDGRIADAFTSSVSHVVVPEGPMPRTYSALLGLLAGCWIVKYSSAAAVRRLLLLPLGLF
ncbi:BRCA1-associated RING domain protein 1 isoform X2 [Hippocampus zosterae]|uniref:BRCA1-associated RING domain protein 1 isoform X2 n=1 Tax=Hippocampus zosterae TaxID=109293 RepID=UPI00223DF789|nr:BRCA1-associated RING domain protein 1 isoform X2 [Hippocampus zosterae]